MQNDANFGDYFSEEYITQEQVNKAKTYIPNLKFSNQYIFDWNTDAPTEYEYKLSQLNTDVDYFTEPTSFRFDTKLWTVFSEVKKASQILSSAVFHSNVHSKQLKDEVNLTISTLEKALTDLKSIQEGKN